MVTVYVLVGALILVTAYAYGLRRRVHDLQFRDFTRRMDGQDALADIRNTRLEAERRMCDIGLRLPRKES